MHSVIFFYMPGHPTDCFGGISFRTTSVRLRNYNLIAGGSFFGETSPQPLAGDM